VLNVPNLLTLLRILSVPVYLSLLVDGSYRTALLVFAVAGLTDALDGAIARLTDSRTELGAHLDPLADKLLLVSSFIALSILGLMPVQLMIIVIVRDVVILGGVILTSVVLGGTPGMSPSVSGKVTTFLQLLTVALVLIDVAEVLEIDEVLLWVVYAATAVACFVSGAGYVVAGSRIYQSAGSDE